MRLIRYGKFYEGLTIIETKFRYIIQFSKQGPLRFIGHLDLCRVFRLLVRRSGLPVAYSQGFNPHQLISFALPLPLGMASAHDYAEIFLTAETAGNETTEAFNASAPEGLRILCVKPSPDGPGVAACASAADYIWDAQVDERIASGLLNRSEIIVPKKTKSGVKDTDIRPDIFSIVCEPSRVIMRLSAGSQSFLNPLTVAGLLRDASHITTSQFTRAEMYRYANDGPVISTSSTRPGAFVPLLNL